MTRYIAVVTLALLVILVLLRAFQLRKLGIKSIQFGEMDKKDFIIPPFALLLFYLVLASAFGLPAIGMELFYHEWISWIGVAFCVMGILLFIGALISFGKSFRVGLDENHPGELVTTGAFSISRNPIYVAFGLVLIGIFLIISNWIILIYVFAGIWVLNRQVLLEEQSLKKIYGEKYIEYCNQVRRYL
ncbi:methyltransferase family protein [Konateibacter massiliensis]|uniref:methyltransferase family protein n=1 Tax=Konateibacter massiliensis TaxID=2002841 RepID=UPI000C14879A|nr:isoprenylcysteine carboxylmethyltransferase family protein [Konateibacter massiliensis]